MACTQEEIQQSALEQFLQLDFAGVTSKTFNNQGIMIFDYNESKKYNTEIAAKAARKSIKSKLEPIIENWAKDTFGPAFTKGFLAESYGNGRVFLKFNFPQKLKDAYKIKEEYQQRNLAYEEMMALEKIAKKEAKNDLIEMLSKRDENAHRIYDVYGYQYKSLDDYMNSLLEDDYDEMIASPNQIIVQPSYEDYILHKQNLIKKIEKTISKLYNEKRVNNTPHINQKIARFNNIKESLEKDIHDFTKTSDKLSITKDFFEKDFKLIEDLLSQPTLENIFLAKDLFNYIKNSTDIRIENIKKNKLFNLPANKKFEEAVDILIQEQNVKINKQERDIELAVDKVFLNLLEKNEDNLSKLHPGKSLEEIKDELLKNLQDIGWIESMFFTQGEQLSSGNNIIEDILKVEYKKEVLRQSAKAQKNIQSIDALLPSVEKELDSLGKKIKSKLGSIYYTGYDYRFLYQKDSNGNFKSSLIGKFSLNWEKFIAKLNSQYNKDIFNARQNKDWAEVERLLQNKFIELNDKTEFVNFTLLHDIFDDSKYDEFKKGTSEEAEKYKQELINKIGQEEYENIIENQKNLLDNYIEEVNLLTEFKLLQENVTSIDDLSDTAKIGLEIAIKRLNPVELLNSYFAGNKGMVQYSIGTQMNEKPSFMKYNTVIPKLKNNLGIDTNFYDNDFSFIENNSTLYNFWKVIRQSTHLINENLIDSNLRLNANSLLLMKKQFAEESINKDTKEIVREGLGKMTNLKQFIKNIFSAKESKFNTEDEVILPTEIKSFENEVNKEFDLLKTDLANIIGKQSNMNNTIVFDILPLDQQEKISELLGFSNVADFKSDIGKNNFKVFELKQYSERKVMSQQTLDTPMMIKAFLELSSEHKARTKAQNEINIYREKSASILNEKNTMFSQADTKRKRELERQKFFYDKVVLNKNQKDHNWNYSKKLLESASFADGKVNTLLLGRIFYKNFTKEEKEIYNSANTRLKNIEEEIKNTNSSSMIASLNEEKNDLEARLQILGKDYLFSALFDNFFNELSVKMGLGYNILANIKNRIQGLTAVISRDGEFWTKGNIYPVNHFVGLNKTRFINPSYKEEWDKATLFIKQLNLIQDTTNELQRAESKIKQKARIFSPMYGTEVIEYYNQVPGILAMAMDIEITDINGVKHPLFDGSSFIAYNNNNGVLELKPEFRTSENIQHFEQMDSEDMINWKINVGDMINSLNGDYSKTGVTQIKGGIYTRPLMQFKTWLPKYIHSRYRINQKNIQTGQTETGYMISTMLNKKTSITGSLLLASTGLLGVASTSPIIVAGAITAFAIGKGYSIYNRKNISMIDSTEAIAINDQLLYLLQLINPIRYAEMPVNVLLGKEFIKPAETKFEKQLTSSEKKDLRLLMRNLQTLILLMMIKLLIQALLADNEEDEPKGEPGSEQRKRYEAQQKRREEFKTTHNFYENLLTGMYHETSLATEPTSIISAMGSKNSLEGSVEKLIKSSTLLVRGALYGDDKIMKGERQGQSKFQNSLRKTFLPSLFRDIGQDTWRGGFEQSMENEWITDETIDGIFDTDYKKDVKKAKNKREDAKLHFIEEYEQKNNIDIDELEMTKKEAIEKLAKKVAKSKAGKPKRQDYDENQEKK